MSAERTVPDMDELVQRWVALGDRTLPKDASKAIPGKKSAPSGRSLKPSKKKVLSAEERLRETERTIQVKIQNEDDLRVLAPLVQRKYEEITEPELPLPKPETICPYCDLPLPRSPSAKLQLMLNTALQKSTADPRPDNSLGRIALTAVKAPICAQHRLERDLIPKAQYNGWKEVIDFEDVERRIESMASFLQTLVDDTSGDENGLRASNFFWTNAVKVTNKANVGLAGNFSNFHFTQPGYYGERGQQIIHKTLLRVLKMSEETALPLTVLQLISFVLMPEVATRLIMDDMGIDYAKAIENLIASSTYGAFMFPAEEV
ncbi:hypothetical protein R3P38DRAFT_3253535 [Favolaschia claudopus]|uniref:Restriction of telomere capping protein 4 n=1 Tax=Favolaschia claudopus TaxID=2862362 RepID=A0AAW0DVB5_9AGAR